MVKQTFKIIDGVYVGPEVWEGYLDLREYRDTLTSLGDLKEAGGSLYLNGCTHLVSLGSLKKVGGSLYLIGCTSLVSLGSLKEVGDWAHYEGGILSLQYVQEKIRYYSSLPLHEALNALHTNNVQSVPLYKNILLQTLQGVSG
jgi:hypothetical protein